MDESELFRRLDRIVLFLEDMAKKPSLVSRIANGMATGAGIMGILSVIEVINRWVGG